MQGAACHESGCSLVLSCLLRVWLPKSLVVVPRSKYGHSHVDGCCCWLLAWLRSLFFMSMPAWRPLAKPRTGRFPGLTLPLSECSHHEGRISGPPVPNSRAQACMELFFSLPELKATPDVVTYSAAISACQKALGKLRGVSRVLKLSGFQSPGLKLRELRCHSADPQGQGVRGEVRQGRQPARSFQHYQRRVQVHLAAAQGLDPGGQDQVHPHGSQVQGCQRGDVAGLGSLRCWVSGFRSGFWKRGGFGASGLFKIMVPPQETATGVHRLREMAAKGELLFPAINVNDCRFFCFVLVILVFTENRASRNTLLLRTKRAAGLRYQEQVRQRVRLPPLSAGQHHARHGRDDRRQACPRGRLRRCGQGLRLRHAWSRRTGADHGDRPHLRAAGVHGGLPGRDPWGVRGWGGHLHLRHRQLQDHHPGACTTCPNPYASVMSSVMLSLVHIVIAFSIFGRLVQAI